MRSEGGEVFDRLLGSLYDAVLAPDGFQEFIRELAQLFRLKGVCLVERDLTESDTTALWLYGLEPQWLESYVMTYGREDLLARHLEQAPIGHFYASNLPTGCGFRQARVRAGFGRSASSGAQSSSEQIERRLRRFLFARAGTILAI